MRHAHFLHDFQSLETLTTHVERNFTDISVRSGILAWWKSYMQTKELFRREP